MKWTRLHKAFIIFFTFVTLLVAAVINVIETEEFTDLFSSRIQLEVQKLLGVDLEFSNISIGFFPPRTVFHNVEIDKKDENKSYYLAVEEVSVQLSYWDMLLGKIAIGDISLNRGGLKIEDPSIKFESSQESTLPDKIYISQYFDEIEKVINEKLPIKIINVNINYFDLVVNDYSLWINYLRLANKKELSIAFDLDSLNFTKHLDSLALHAIWQGEKINIDRFEVRKDQDYLKLSADIYDDNGNPKFNLNSQFFGRAKQGFDYLGTVDSELASINGVWKVNVTAKGTLKDFDADVEGEINDFRSVYADADRVEFTASKRGNDIKVDSGKVYKDGGTASLKAPIYLWDGNDVPLLSSKIEAKLVNYYTSNGLKYIDEYIYPLKGYVTGDLDVEFSEKGYNFVLKDGSVLKNFQLLFGPDEVPVLKNKQLNISNLSMFLDNNLDLFMDLDIGFEQSRLKGHGFIGVDKIEILATSDDFNFEHFGPISDVPLKGNGHVDFKARGPLDNVSFDIVVAFEDTEVVDLNLGRASGAMTLTLNDLLLKIHKLEGQKNESVYNTNGEIRFEDDRHYRFGVRFDKGTYRDLLDIYKAYLPVEMMPKGLAFNYKGDYFVQGSLNDKYPQISGEISANNLTWFNESADKLRTKFVYKDNFIDVEYFNISKRSANLVGSVKSDLTNNYLEYDGKLSGLRLHDISMYSFYNFGYEGELEGTLHGSGKLDNLVTKTDLKVVNGNIFDKATMDSKFLIQTKGSDFFIKSNILGRTLVLDSYLNLDFDHQKQPSYVNLDFNTRNVKLITGFISKHNSADSSILGRFSGSLKSSFNFDSIKSLDLIFEVDEFVFKRGDLRLVQNFDRSSIIIDDGIIKLWNFALDGKNASFSTTGSGNLVNKFDIETNFNTDTSLLELFTSRIRKMSGPIAMKWKLVGDKLGKVNSNFKLNINDVFLKLEDIPNVISSLFVDVELADNKLLIKNFKSKFGLGGMSGSGTAILKKPYPKVDLRFQIDQTKTSFFKNSNVVWSGVGRMTGDQPPYNLVGDASILYGELFDDFSDYSLSGGESIDNRFIPKPIDVGYINFFNYNLDVKTVSPVYLKNQIADIQLVGHTSVSGDYHNPLFNGEVSVLNDKGTIQLKGHEFKLTEGKIVLNDDAINSPPMIKAIAYSDIQNYKVKIDLSGTVKDYSLKLTSDPVLSQQDILSLLTLGITSNVANNLDDAGRKSITSLSLGSLLIDQLMLQGGMNANSGIKVSVAPEFGESDESLLSGRTSTGTSASQMKSATKVKLQTNISKKVNLSFSSTLGGSLSQKQEMNVNYDLGNNMTVKGIYESEDPEANSTSTGSSFGFDFQYRKTFK